ncbi:hypothetical protein ACJJTC_006529 [Scirpophaga incertulas]
MKRRNAESGKMRRPVKRTKITEGMFGNSFVYVKFVTIWAAIVLADYMLEFRFEFLWPFWMMLRSVYDSFKYQGIAFSVFFICIALTSDMICYFFIPVQYIFFAASTYVWVQYIWHTFSDRGLCLPTLVVCCMVVCVEGALRAELGGALRAAAAAVTGSAEAALEAGAGSGAGGAAEGAGRGRRVGRAAAAAGGALRGLPRRDAGRGRALHGAAAAAPAPPAAGARRERLLLPAHAGRAARVRAGAAAAAAAQPLGGRQGTRGDATQRLSAAPLPQAGPQRPLPAGACAPALQGTAASSWPTVSSAALSAEAAKEEKKEEEPQESNDMSFGAL